MHHGSVAPLRECAFKHRNRVLFSTVAVLTQLYRYIKGVDRGR
jgi:hypothetical protein